MGWVYRTARREGVGILAALLEALTELTRWNRT